jgi:hypothetical protein
MPLWVLAALKMADSCFALVEVWAFILELIFLQDSLV